jgi:hypothetical protein
LSRFIALLLIVALLASPQLMVAQEADSDVVEDSLVFAMDGESNPEAGNPDEGNSEAGNSGEGNPEEGTSEAGNLGESNLEEGNLEELNPEEGNPEEGNLEEGSPEESNLEEGNSEEGNPGEGNPEEGNLEEGNVEEGAAAEDSNEDAPLVDPVNNGDVSLVAEPGTGDPAFYCNFQNLTGGDVATWWANNDVAPDCIDLVIENSPTSCSLSASFTSHVFASGYGDLLYWFETDSNGVVLRPAGGGPPLNWGNSGPSGPGQGGGFTLSFPEDYNGGTAYVLINFASPENQIAPGLDQIDLDHWRTTSAGRVYAINTDCEAPVPVDYCDYSQLVGAGDVYNWLLNAPEGADTDCIDVGEPVQSCGTLNIPFSERVEPFTYVLLWAIGTEIPADDSLWNSTWPITFAEDYNGGSVDVIVFIAGPEDDYYHFAGEDPYPYPYPNIDRGDIPARSLGGGVTFTIDTDCVDPVPVDYCDYSQLVGPGDVFSWLDSAPEGADVDCIDVGEPVQSCGTLNIPFSERVEPFVYTLYWAIGDEIPTDTTQWNTTWPITFDEDEGDGEVHVIVFIGGPEDDYYHFANEDPYPYPYPNIDRGDIEARSLGGGVKFTIDTDCDEPKPEEPKPETPKDDKPKGEKPKHPEKAPVVTHLPNTGAGAGANSMIGLAAAAAIAAMIMFFAGAGRFLTSRKR